MNATLEAFKLVAIEKEKSYTAMTLEFQRNMKSHHDALYGFTDSGGKWHKGLIQVVEENEEERKQAKQKIDKAIGWLFIGICSAIGIAIVDFVGKFWKFLTGQH